MSLAATEHPNARRMREIAQLVARGELAAALERYPEDVVWFASAWRGGDRLYRGRAALRRFFDRLQEQAGGTLAAEVVDVLGSDNHVVIFLRVTATRADKHLDVLVAHFASVGPRGFSRNWFLPSDTAAWNRFFR